MWIRKVPQRSAYMTAFSEMFVRMMSDHIRVTRSHSQSQHRDKPNMRSQTFPKQGPKVWRDHATSVTGFHDREISIVVMISRMHAAAGWPYRLNLSLRITDICDRELNEVQIVSCCCRVATRRCTSPHAMVTRSCASCCSGPRPTWRRKIRCS